MTEETLFELALNTPAADRPALLDRECADDPTLRARVEALLAAHERLEAGSCRDPRPPMPARAGEATEPPVTTEPPPDTRPAEGVGSLLAGKYKLVEEIGEGGMGAVFLAQQTEPVQAHRRRQGHQGRHGLPQPSSPASRPSARPWP